MTPLMNYVLIGAAAVGLVMWVIALGGVGAATAKCSDAGGSSEQCGRVTGFAWWTIFATLFLLLAVLAGGVFNLIKGMNPLYRFRLSLVALFTVSAATLMVNAALVNQFDRPGLTGSYASAADAATAGLSLLACAVVVIIVLLADFMTPVDATTANAPANKANVVPARQAPPAPVMYTTQPMPMQHSGPQMPPV